MVRKKIGIFVEKLLKIQYKFYLFFLAQVPKQIPEKKCVIEHGGYGHGGHGGGQEHGGGHGDDHDDFGGGFGDFGAGFGGGGGGFDAGFGDFDKRSSTKKV